MAKTSAAAVNALLFGKALVCGGWTVVGRLTLLACAGLLLAGCGEPERRQVTEVPAPPGASLRADESAFQLELVARLLPPGKRPREIRVYATPIALARVVDFYEPYFAPDSATVARFAVAGRMRQLAEAVRGGGAQQLEVGRLLFGRGRAPDSLAAAEVADSLAALAERFAGVEGVIAIGRIPLATTPRREALVTIERPHLNPLTLSVDSLSVVTVATQDSLGR